MGHTAPYWCRAFLAAPFPPKPPFRPGNDVSFFGYCLVS